MLHLVCMVHICHVTLLTSMFVMDRKSCGSAISKTELSGNFLSAKIRNTTSGLGANKYTSLEVYA
jgi:hypothetical protein